MSAKRGAPAPEPSSFDVVAALFAERDSGPLSDLILIAATELRGVIAAGFDEDEITEVVKRIASARSAHDRDSIRAVDKLQRESTTPAMPTRTNDALGEIQWILAHAGFALGVVVGMRLGGGR